MNTLQQLRAGTLAGTTRLNLREGLSEFPREIFALADSLEILDLSGNALSSLPDELPRLHRLQVLFCADNRFTELPEVLGRCPRLRMIGFKANRICRVSGAALPPTLRWLILTDNAVETLPAEIGRCSQLQKLMLAGNRLQTLPPTLARCQRLELLRIAANRLDELPPWLLALPRLCWLAYAGNPFCRQDDSQAPRNGVGDIAWAQLRLQQKLGEGASGVIHQAELQAVGGSRPVAVKRFRGAVTSDGLPGSEMAACLGAGEHPNLIPVLGRLTEHPEQAEGLVLALIAPEFRKLAGPPSLDSCSRDIYPPDFRLPASAVLAIARGIASAARQLHARGILHGDLYAHNILHDGRGHALLGDFGAASFFAAGRGETAEALQRLEARAFGCLLEELLERCVATPEHQALVRALDAIKQRCLQDDPGARPLFDELDRRLNSLTDSERKRPTPMLAMSGR